MDFWIDESSKIGLNSVFQSRSKTTVFKDSTFTPFHRRVSGWSFFFRNIKRRVLIQDRISLYLHAFSFSGLRAKVILKLHCYDL